MELVIHWNVLNRGYSYSQHRSTGNRGYIFYVVNFIVRNQFYAHLYGVWGERLLYIVTEKKWKKAANFQALELARK